MKMRYLFTSMLLSWTMVYCAAEKIDPDLSALQGMDASLILDANTSDVDAGDAGLCQWVQQDVLTVCATQDEIARFGHNVTSIIGARRSESRDQ